MYLTRDWSVAKLGIKIWSTYRFEFIAVLINTPLTLIIYYFLWKSIFSYMAVEVIRGFTFQEMINYYAIGMIVSFFTWSEVDRWIENDLLHGRMIVGMLKPVSFLSYYWSFEAGINLMNIIWQMIPVFIISFAFFGLRLAPIFNFVAFIFSLLFAFLIYFGLTYLLGLSAFWLKRITGLRRLRRILIGFLSGTFLPLTLFPQVFQDVLNYSPFPYTKFVPISIYLGTLSDFEVIKALLVQVGWIVVLYFIAHFVFRQAYKRYSSVGL